MFFHLLLITAFSQNQDSLSVQQLIAKFMINGLTPSQIYTTIMASQGYDVTEELIGNFTNNFNSYWKFVRPVFELESSFQNFTSVAFHYLPFSYEIFESLVLDRNPRSRYFQIPEEIQAGFNEDISRNKKGYTSLLKALNLPSEDIYPVLEKYGRGENVTIGDIVDSLKIDTQFFADILSFFRLSIANYSFTIQDALIYLGANIPHVSKLFAAVREPFDNNTFSVQNCFNIFYYYGKVFPEFMKAIYNFPINVIKEFEIPINQIFNVLEYPITQRVHSLSDAVNFMVGNYTQGIGLCSVLNVSLDVLNDVKSKLDYIMNEGIHVRKYIESTLGVEKTAKLFNLADGIIKGTDNIYDTIRKLFDYLRLPETKSIFNLFISLVKSFAKPESNITEMLSLFDQTFQKEPDTMYSIVKQTLSEISDQNTPITGLSIFKTFINETQTQELWLQMKQTFEAIEEGSSYTLPENVTSILKMINSTINSETPVFELLSEAFNIKITAPTIIQYIEQAALQLDEISKTASNLTKPIIDQMYDICIKVLNALKSGPDFSIRNVIDFLGLNSTLIIGVSTKCLNILCQPIVLKDILPKVYFINVPDTVSKLSKVQIPSFKNIHDSIVCGESNLLSPGEQPGITFIQIFPISVIYTITSERLINPINANTLTINHFFVSFGANMTFAKIVGEAMQNAESNKEMTIRNAFISITNVSISKIVAFENLFNGMSSNSLKLDDIDQAIKELNGIITPTPVPSDTTTDSGISELIPSDKTTDSGISEIIPSDKTTDSGISEIIPSDKTNDSGFSGLIPSDKNNDNSKDSSLSAGVIAGIVVPIVIIVIASAVVLFFAWKVHMRNKENEESGTGDQNVQV